MSVLSLGMCECVNMSVRSWACVCVCVCARVCVCVQECAELHIQHSGPRGVSKRSLEDGETFKTNVPTSNIPTLPCAVSVYLHKHPRVVGNICCLGRAGFYGGGHLQRAVGQDGQQHMEPMGAFRNSLGGIVVSGLLRADENQLLVIIPDPHYSQRLMYHRSPPGGAERLLESQSHHLGLGWGWVGMGYLKLNPWDETDAKKRNRGTERGADESKRRGKGDGVTGAEL